MRSKACLRAAGAPLTRALAVILAAGAFAVSAAGPARAAALGPHDDGTANPCRKCHSIAASEPALRGWAGTGAGPTGGQLWGAKPISNLCYMCHESQGGGMAASDMSSNAYDDRSHLFTVDNAPEDPDGSPPTAVPTSGLPYTGTAGLECTSCHNTHLSTNRPYNQRADIQALCGSCHPGRLNNDSATGYPGAVLHGYETHPTRQAMANTAVANIKDVSLMAANLKVDVSGSWSLGGHLYAETAFDCQTCHAVHGPTLDTPGFEDLLAIDNATVVPGGSPLCEGCHYGGDAGQQVGTVAADGTTVVYSDHPIDAANNLAFYPTGAALPNGTHVPVNWLSGNPNGDRGARPFYAAGGGATPACSSCHDTHGGMLGTRLLRGPNLTGAGETTWNFSYGTWCFLCHLAGEVIPAGHHSSINNCSTAGGATIDSQLDCGDCHGPAAGGLEWKAHNGFWAFAEVVSDTNSLYCLGCHVESDPVAMDTSGLKNVEGSLVSPAPMPAGHGTPRGTASHFLGPDSNEFPGVTPKTDAWSSGYTSEYGSDSAVICESCHNIIYNDGRAHPAAYTSPETAGWESNLLLEPYADDSPGLGDGTGAYGVGSALCLGCHDEPQPHHALTGSIVSISGLALRTALTGYADQTAAPIGGGDAPGTLSYPNTDALDCDSCHRPHQANNDSIVSGAQHGFKTSTDGLPTSHILEVDGSGHAFTPTLCPECHAR